VREGEALSEAAEEEKEEKEEGEEVEGEGETSMNTTGTLLFGQSNPRGRGLSLGPTRDLTRPP
jgi:hypothetical protein